MAYVVWKIINGKGPYAYLRKSERVDGRVRTRHLGYLGYWSADGGGTVGPGSVVSGPNGEQVVVPGFSPSMLRRLGATAAEVAGALATTSEDSDCALATTPESPSATTSEEPKSPLATTVSDAERPLATTAEEAESPLATTSEEAASPLATTGQEEPGVPAQATPVRPHRLPDGTWGVGNCSTFRIRKVCIGCVWSPHARLPFS